MPQAPVRLPFNAEVQQRCQAFADDLLRLVPELDAVAIVPSYTVPQDRLSAGVMRGRGPSGTLGSAGEIQHMSMQLHLVQRQLLERQFQILQAIDQRMGEFAAMIREQQGSTNESQNNGASAPGDGPTGDRTAPEGAGPSPD